MQLKQIYEGSKQNSVPVLVSSALCVYIKANYSSNSFPLMLHVCQAKLAADAAGQTQLCKIHFSAVKKSGGIQNVKSLFI